MRKLSIEQIEAVIGKPMAAVLMKQIATLDDESSRVLTASPLAGFGYRDDQGIPHTTFIGGRPGFVQVLSPERIAVAIGLEQMPQLGSGVSFVFMLPGMGDTFRLNGSVVKRARERVEIGVAEGFIHSPKCMLRSGLWKPAQPASTAALTVEEFLATSSFVLVSTWNSEDASDTSPRGDPAGFIKRIDSHTLAIPDRKGNRRIDTFRNLASCEQISLAAVVAGRDELLHIHGTAWVTDDPALLSTMALKDAAPHLALCVRVTDAQLSANAALRAARPWQLTQSDASHADLPNLIELGAQHLASNKDDSLKAGMLRLAARLLGAFPTATRRLIESALRRDLEKEGYGDPP